MQLIDEETFEAAQAKIEGIHERYSADSDEADDIEDLIEEFGLRAVVESIPAARFYCLDCDAKMVKNGQRTLTDRRVHSYKCPECGRQEKHPTARELDRMEKKADEDDQQ